MATVKLKQLIDEKGDKFYPITHSNSVIRPTGEAVEESLNKLNDDKLDKETSTSSYNRLYAIGTDGQQLIYETQQSGAKAGSIPRRTNQTGEYGAPMYTGTPTVPGQAANKAYVDEATTINKILIENLDSAYKLLEADLAGAIDWSINLFFPPIPTEGLIFTTIVRDTIYSIVTGCSNKEIETLVIPAEKSGGPVTIIDESAFEEYTNLKSVIMPNTITDIGQGAFAWCSKLENVFIGSNVTDIGYGAFTNCSSLKTIDLPNSVTSIGEAAFQFCESVTNIKLGQGLKHLGDYSLSGLTNITNITIPSSVESMGIGPFLYNTSLTSIDVGLLNNNFNSMDGVLFDYNKTKLICYPGGKIQESYSVPATVTTIDIGAFIMNSKLVHLTIPASIIDIGEAIVLGCEKLQTITVLATTPPALSEFTYDEVNFTVYVPAVSLDAYKSAEGWKDISDKIQPIT